MDAILNFGRHFEFGPPNHNPNHNPNPNLNLNFNLNRNPNPGGVSNDELTDRHRQSAEKVGGLTELRAFFVFPLFLKIS